MQREKGQENVPGPTRVWLGSKVYRKQGRSQQGGSWCQTPVRATQVVTAEPTLGGETPVRGNGRGDCGGGGRAPRHRNDVKKQVEEQEHRCRNTRWQDGCPPHAGKERNEGLTVHGGGRGRTGKQHRPGHSGTALTTAGGRPQWPRRARLLATPRPALGSDLLASCAYQSP